MLDLIQLLFKLTNCPGSEAHFYETNLNSSNIVASPLGPARSIVLLGLDSPSSIGCIDDVADTDVSKESDR